MRKTKEVPVVWHKGWPPVPTDHTCYEYLLTVKNDGELDVVTDWYISFAVFQETCEDDVVAWAELPEPFDPDEEDEE